MKTKLSPLEELKSERLKLKQECGEHKERVEENLKYVKGNFGSLLVSSVFSPSGSNRSSCGSSGSYMSFISPVVSALPSIWNFAQPFLIGMATKKATSLLFRKKKKKKK